MSNLEYYLESIGDNESFNLWVKQGNKYFNIATLFYQDPLCGTQWTVKEKEKTVSYGEQEIQDELESPLKRIQDTIGEGLLALRDKSPEEIIRFLRGEK